MRRFYCDQPLALNQQVQFNPEQSHYISQVLRLRNGVPLVLFNGDGQDYNAQLVQAHRKKTIVQILDCKPNRTNQARIGLIQSLAKQDKMDWIIQKATELGIAAIQPTHSRYSVVRLNEQKASKRTEHWQRVIHNACEQSGRAKLPSLLPINNLEDNIIHCPQTTVLHPFTATSWQPPACSYDTLQPIQWIAVGPEGGFDNNEVTLLQQHGAKVMSFGIAILRTETCAIAALSHTVFNLFDG